MSELMRKTTDKLPNWVLGIFPLFILLGFIALFLLLDPLAFFTGDFPPVEVLSIQQVTFPEDGRIQLSVLNGGPDPITIAQVTIDDAYWQYEMTPSNTLTRLQRGTITLDYPWVNGEPLPIVLLTSTGLTFATAVEVVVLSPQRDAASFAAFGLLGIYVGVIPVLLGMMWYPFMRRVDTKWINAFLALTIGLLIFLFVDTVLEAVEISAAVPGVFQGIPVIIFGMLASLGVLLAVSQRRRGESPVAVAAYIALGIGLHNFGEGLAIGAAFATGAAALGSFLVIGFTLHNITEGVGIAAPLTKEENPRLRTFILLGLLAGMPAMLGTWVGGFAFNPYLAVLFLSIGAGAILQVIWEVGKLLVNDAQRRNQPAISWLNFGGIAAGILIMYVTAFLVKF